MSKPGKNGIESNYMISDSDYDPKTCWGALDLYGNWLWGQYNIRDETEAIRELGHTIGIILKDMRLYKKWSDGGRQVMRYDEYLKLHPNS